MPTQAVKTRRSDSRVTIRQIGGDTLAAIGARDYVQSDAAGWLHFRVGSGRRVRKVTITLTAADTYDVEVGRMDRKTYEWISEARAENVYADNLGGTVYRLFVEVES